MTATTMDSLTDAAFAEAPAPRPVPFSALFPYMALAATAAVFLTGTPAKLAAARRARAESVPPAARELTPTIVSYPVLDAPNDAR